VADFCAVLAAAFRSLFFLLLNAAFDIPSRFGKETLLLLPLFLLSLRFDVEAPCTHILAHVGFQNIDIIVEL
jgi:hypothetical protein